MKKKAALFIKDYVVPILIALVIVNIVGISFVVGESMQPTLENRDVLVIDKITPKFASIDYGDIVIFKSSLERNTFSNKILVKRVIGIPGDIVEIRNGNVFVNNTFLEEEYIDNSFTAGELIIYIPENKVFVLGDNRNHSEDSRSSVIGLVDKKDIIGKAILRVFPTTDFELLNTTL
ncbi:signal peptidase I [Natronincola peptidivorans]|uniref:Signal peptidase I n=1 Tax=Natronincola peptidivorans TaxID=426128 RepID=A0A1I0F9D0_9FIRM|nr:signal peptidase I [Natronincola peptidivorans]SET54712.1 signal peptidase I [Natronincola peptidivorans]